MRHRITVRGDGIELRGYCDDEELLIKLAKCFENNEPAVMIIVSPTDEHYNPFSLDEL